MGRFDDAEPYFRTVLQRIPAMLSTHFNLGYTLDKRRPARGGDCQTSAKAMRLRPALDRAWYGLGLAYAALGRHREAAEALKQAATLQPMNPARLVRRSAWRYHALGEPGKLKEVAAHLVRFDPKMTRRLIQDAKADDLAYLVRDLVV